LRFSTLDALHQMVNFLSVSFDLASQFSYTSFPRAAARTGKG
jgi:hypothetical protein